MKGNIIQFILLSLLCFGSCSREKELNTGGGNVGPMTRAGFLGYAISLDDFDDREEDGFGVTDDIKTIRFIIFTDLYTYPKAEVNELEDNLISSAVSTERLSALRGFFELSPADKMVVAIANEPTGLSGRLDSVKTPRDLEEIDADLELDKILSPDHLSLPPGVMMPMSGVVFTKREDMKKTKKEVMAMAAKDLPKIEMSRMLARVDIYMTTDIPGGITLRGGSSVELGNTFTLSPFVRHEIGSQKLGRMQTVSPGRFTARRWEVAATGVGPFIAENADPAVPVCSFYTPERFCPTDKDKLTVDILLKTDDGDKKATIKLKEMHDGENILRPIDAVRRNNRYVVNSRIRERKIEFGVEVMRWNEGLEAFPLGQYRLTVDKSHVVFPAFPKAGYKHTVTVGANHPAGWNIEETGNLPAGVTAQRVGTTDFIEITAADNAAIMDTSGSLTIRSGNLRKVIHVTQEGNKRYTLTVSQNVYEFSPIAEKEQMLTVETDDPNGWMVSPAPSQWPDWIVKKWPLEYGVGGHPVTAPLRPDVNLGNRERSFTFTFTAGTLSETVTIKQAVATISGKRTYGWGQINNTAGYIMQPGAGTRKIVDAPINFGTDDGSAVKIERFSPTSTFDHSLLTNGDAYDPAKIREMFDRKPDIVLTGFDIDVSATKQAEVAGYMMDYLKAGGTMILALEHPGLSQAFFEALFPGSTINITWRTTNTFRIENVGDEITKGPFGDIGGRSWGNDSNGTRAIGGIPEDDVVVYSRDENGSPTMFRHKVYNLMFIGDGGAFANYDGTPGENAGTTAVTTHPLAFDTAGRPITRTNWMIGNNVENGRLFANIMAWAVKQADTKGINSK